MSPTTLLTAGEALSLDGDTLTVNQIQRRNWSVVGTGRWRGRQVFLKQFVDRAGRPHRTGFEGDVMTHEALLDGGALPPNVRAPHLESIVEDRLVVVSELVPCITIDDLLTGVSDRGHAARIGRAARSILDHRRSMSPARSVVPVWKGFDPKNLGVADDGSVIVFDFGPPTRQTIDEAVERACAYALASGWRATPSTEWWLRAEGIVRSVTEPMAVGADRDAVFARLDQLFRHRRREPLRSGPCRTLKQAGVLTVGPLYRWRARRLFDSLASSDQRERSAHAIAS